MDEIVGALVALFFFYKGRRICVFQEMTFLLQGLKYLDFMREIL